MCQKKAGARAKDVVGRIQNGPAMIDKPSMCIKEVGRTVEDVEWWIQRFNVKFVLYSHYLWAVPTGSMGDGLTCHGLDLITGQTGPELSDK
jgi:tRNA isopentenyl-2-thiomethyl-A-37 hydroxylase MiaE